MRRYNIKDGGHYARTSSSSIRGALVMSIILTDALLSVPTRSYGNDVTSPLRSVLECQLPSSKDGRLPWDCDCRLNLDTYLGTMAMTTSQHTLPLPTCEN